MIPGSGLASARELLHGHLGVKECILSIVLNSLISNQVFSHIIAILPTLPMAGLGPYVAPLIAIPQSVPLHSSPSSFLEFLPSISRLATGLSPPQRTDLFLVLCPILTCRDRPSLFEHFVLRPLWMLEPCALHKVYESGLKRPANPETTGFQQVMSSGLCHVQLSSRIHSCHIEGSNHSTMCMSCPVTRRRVAVRK